MQEPTNNSKKGSGRKKLKDLSTEEFFSHGLDSDICSDDEEEDVNSIHNTSKLSENGDGIHSEDVHFKHKAALKRLEDKDPEFFKYLKENDQELLEFDESDASSSDEEEGNQSDSDKEDGKMEIESHSHSEDVKEDEMETEELEENISNKNDFVRDGETVSLQTLAKLKKGLEKNSLLTLRKTMRIFHDAVAEAAENEGGSKEKVKYKVENSNVFNNLVHTCLKNVSVVLQHHLLKDQKPNPKKIKLPSSGKQWSKVKVTVKNYLMDLLQLLRQLAEPSMVAVIVRHVQDLVLYYICFPKIAKMLIKRLVRMWSSGEEHVRVLSFLCIRKTAIYMPQLFDLIVKQLYLGFVKHAKFLNAKTKPLIAFMQNSLIEMFAMDHGITYQYGFIYIRQMAIHLRNAITLKKKDAYQSVYNWQYISCLQLWSRVLGELHSETLAPLIYPVVQVALGVVRLIPTTRYYPLRFHCLHSLNMLSKATDTYIPVASYLVEALESPEFNKKTKPSTAKAPDLSCVLKVPKSQLHTRAFQDCVMENVCELILEHFVNLSTSIAFPELVFPICLRMKRFMKKTEVAKFSKQIKQIVDKLQEAGHEVSRKRSSVTFSPKDIEEVQNWENAYAQQKNSLQKFFETWQKMKEISNANSKQDDTGDLDNDEENESDEESKPEPKRRKKTETANGESKKTQAKGTSKKKDQNAKMPVFSTEPGVEADDIVEDFELSSDEE